MARYFNIDGKIIRKAIASGKYENFTIITKVVSYRKEIFILDGKTKKTSL